MFEMHMAKCVPDKLFLRNNTPKKMHISNVDLIDCTTLYSNINKAYSLYDVKRVFCLNVKI